jgi:hypothetical protein
VAVDKIHIPNIVQNTTLRHLLAGVLHVITYHKYVPCDTLRIYNNNNNNNNILTATGLSPGGSGYFTCIEVYKADY